MREAWTESQKWTVAVDRLREDAAAWHRYEGLKQQSWVEWSSKLIASLRPDALHLPSTTQFNLTTTEDKAQEGFRLQVAVMRCSSLELSDSVPSSNSSSAQPKTAIEDGPREERHSNDLPTLNHHECAAVPCISFDDLLAERSTGYTETGSKAGVTLPMPGSTPGPISRTSVPATNAISKTELSETTVDSKETIVHQCVPHLQSSAELVSYIDAFQSERSSIGLSGNMMYDLADGDKHAILTLNVQPERRAYPHEVVTMEIAPDCSGHDQLSQNKNDNSKEAAGTSHHDCVQWLVRAHLTLWCASIFRLGIQMRIKTTPPHSDDINVYSASKDCSNTPTVAHQISTPCYSVLKTYNLCTTSFIPPSLHRPRCERNPMPNVKNDTLADQGNKYTQRAKSQPRRVRPRRGSQCHPPELFSLSLPNTSNLTRDQPQRQNLFRPSENALEALQTWPML
ncbi:hypothetical protein HPB51_021541 [Rhipicephalus microplus]|uniref:Uncharacterized protein n=1 Tax=Rhipicephalus microplus TaxID=6941 RepID=A0A9J6EBK5_RHIMP|nr:hypothetical protein HPB51_021541 [Rhipicephalus microplus]